MKIVRDFPHDVEVHDDVRIEMEDGIVLAARLWLPGIAKHDPVPAILEYIPYRRRDGTADRDSISHRWFAGHGYACLREAAEIPAVFSRTSTRSGSWTTASRCCAGSAGNPGAMAASA